MNSNTKKLANEYYLAIQAYEMTQLKDQIKGYIKKSDFLELLYILKLQAWTILKIASFLTIAIQISTSSEFAKE